MDSGCMGLHRESRAINDRRKRPVLGDTQVDANGLRPSIAVCSILTFVFAL